MTDTVYCLGCGQAFPTDGLTWEDHGYPLNSGMCQACVQEGRRRPWQIIAENQTLRERGDEMARAAREVMHGRAHSGVLLLAMKAWTEHRDAR